MSRPLLLLLRARLRPTPGTLRRSSSSPSPPPKPPAPPQDMLSRLPPSLRKYASHFRAQPVTYLTTFLLLHEATAVIPLFLLSYALHAFSLSTQLLDLLPASAQTYREKMSAYLDRKQGGGGWGWGWVDPGWAVDVGVAYAVVKVLVPVRVAGSLWATPWCARRIVGPVGKWVGGLKGRRGKGGSG